MARPLHVCSTVWLKHLFFGLVVLALMPTIARADPFKDAQDCTAQDSHHWGSGAKMNVNYCAGIKAFTVHDYPTAIAALNRAVADGDGGAMDLLGYIYEKGRGVAPDPVRAFGLYRQSAAAGNGDGMQEVARCYRTGTGTARNPAEAERWSHQGAAHGADAPPVAVALRAQPDQADFDAGVQQYKANNHSGAFQTFMRAANAGNARAQLQVGAQYEQADGVARNDAEAVRWYAQGAANGDPHSMKNLGLMYELGNGTPENWALAVQWYSKAANMGYADAAFALGRCYEFGMGVTQDRALALKWFRLSAAGNSQGAYFAKWLADPTNYIGFRNDDESRLVMANKMRFAGDFYGGDSGLMFANSAARTRYLIAFRNSVDYHEAQTRWSVNNSEYQNCERAHGDSCHSPGRAPAIP